MLVALWYPEEFFEHAVVVSLRDTRAIIPDANAGLLFISGNVYTEQVAAVFYGIIDQVVKGAAQVYAVCNYTNRCVGGQDRKGDLLLFN